MAEVSELKTSMAPIKRIGDTITRTLENNEEGISQRQLALLHLKALEHFRESLRQLFLPEAEKEGYVIPPTQFTTPTVELSEEDVGNILFPQKISGFVPFSSECPTSKELLELFDRRIEKERVMLHLTEPYLIGTVPTT